MRLLALSDALNIPYRSVGARVLDEPVDIGVYPLIHNKSFTRVWVSGRRSAYL